MILDYLSASIRTYWSIIYLVCSRLPYTLGYSVCLILYHLFLHEHIIRFINRITQRPGLPRSILYRSLNILDEFLIWYASYDILTLTHPFLMYRVGLISRILWVSSGQDERDRSLWKIFAASVPFICSMFGIGDATILESIAHMVSYVMPLYVLPLSIDSQIVFRSTAYRLMSGRVEWLAESSIILSIYLFDRFCIPILDHQSLIDMIMNEQSSEINQLLRGN